MPMTRELKKRFMGIDDRIEKLEKRKPSQRTNGGEEVVDLSGMQEHLDQTSEFEERVANIEAVLQIPGESDGDVQVLSAWRQVVENLLTKLEDRILKVELRASWTPDEGRDLETKVRDLQTRDRHLTQEMNDNRPILKGMVERLNTLETKPVAGALSQVTGKMVEDIEGITLETEGNTRDMKELKGKNSLVHLLLLALIILLFGISLLT